MKFSRACVTDNISVVPGLLFPPRGSMISVICRVGTHHRGAGLRLFEDLQHISGCLEKSSDGYMQGRAVRLLARTQNEMDLHGCGKGNCARRSRGVMDRSFHGCQSSDIQKSPSSQEGEPASEIVVRMVQSKGAMMENHHAISSSNNHSDAARATEEQNGWYKPDAIRSKRTRSKLRRTQEAPSKSTVLRSLGYHGTQAIPQTTRLNNNSIREDSTQNPILLVGGQLRADDQEHWSTNWNQHGSKAFGSDVTAKPMST